MQRTIIKGAAFMAMLLWAGAATAQEISLPSGLTVTLHDVIMDAAPEVARFRFLAPAIDPAGEALSYDAVADDFQLLCDSYALPALTEAGQEVAEIIITLMDRPVTFGEISPDATQYFEPFRITAGTCIWEQF